jgi:ABC-2 type transport system ATP-binding protein
VTTAIEAHGIGVDFGSVVALDEVSFSVEFGEILGLLGPNGAGKTTAIRVLTTILPPTRGSFGVAGVPGTHPAEVRRRVGVLPESAGYPERQTGREYLRFFARLFGRDGATARRLADALLDQVGLGDRGRSLIGTYSRGMRQRLGIARALVGDPRVVILDEPTLGLDPAGQHQVLELVRTIARDRGATVLLSTHLLDEVEEVCTRVLILNRGRVVADGPIAEVVRRAAAPRSARLRVEAEDAERARRALVSIGPGVAVSPADGQPGRLSVTLGRGADESAAIDILRALTAAGVPVLSFELEGARLSDAFLAMTGAA